MTEDITRGEQLPILTVEALLAADDRPTKTIEVPEWGGSVKIKALSLGGFQDATAAATVNGEIDQQKLAVEMLVLGVVEPHLTRDHVPLLREKSITALTSVMGEISELSAVREQDVTAAERRFPDSTE